VLQVYQIVDVNEVVSESHLVLLFGLVKVTVEHLQNGVLGIHFTIMVLLENLNFFLELFSFSQSEYFTPMGQNFHPVEVSHFLLFDHLRLKIFTSHLHQLLLIV